MGTEELAVTTVVEMRECPSTMESVLELHRAHRRTLGFIPAAGFDDHAKKGQLLVALRDECCIGYLMYRESRRLRRATIVHLCTDPSVRGQGVTRLLLDELKSRTKHLDSIRLRCRRDFDAHQIWPKLGFQIIDEAPGRSVDGHLLVTWSLTHQELPLLRLLAEAERASRFVIAVDANVFFDWGDDSAKGEESHGLLADWLDEHVDLCITAELATEIDRKEDHALRGSARMRARKFRTLTGTPAEFGKALSTATAVLGPATSDQDDSDRRQLAHAVASDADYFVTRDGAILAASDALEERLTTTVARPGDVIRRVNAFLDDVAYEPRRFEGSGLKSRGPQPGAAEEARLAEAFLRSDTGEKKTEFLSEVRRALSDTQCSQLVEIFDRDEHSLLFAVRVTRPDGSLDYTRFRLGRSRLAPTVARQYLATELAIRSADVFMVSDRGTNPAAIAAFEDAGFLSTGETWIKAGRVGIEPSESAISWVEGRPEHVRPLAAHARALVDAGRMVEAERLFWPTKFEDLDVPSYIVPIRPAWAMQLFDTKLAERDLFGLPAELGFAFENAYFRAARPGVLSAPGRVLWYVSGDVNAVRACSYIDQVIVGPANDLFRRFRRLGIYEWPNICKLTDGDPTAPIMVVQFSGTELFEQPVSFKMTQELLSSHGRSPNQFASPVAITPRLFGAIYRTGRNLDQEPGR